MISLFMKGFLIGIGKILPGVSGSMLAISFGLYDKILRIISHPFKNIKEDAKFLFPICIGFLISIIFFSNILYYLINNHYVIMLFIFLGMILGSTFDLRKEVKYNFQNILFFLLSFSLVIILSFIKQTEEIKEYSFFYLLLIGFIEALTTIIPGISGTAIFMLMGCYDLILKLFSNCFLLPYFKYGIPFAIGIIFGIILISKLMCYLLEKKKSITYSSIMGFMFGTIFILGKDLFLKINNIWQLIFGIILFFLSFKLVRKID